MTKEKTTTMRITRDECRLFAILLNDIETDRVFESTTFSIAKLTKLDFFRAMDNMRKKFESSSSDARRNSERFISNDYSDLMARLTKKYK